MLAIPQGLVIKIFSPFEIVLGSENVMSFNVMMDLIPFQVILALLPFDPKFF